MTQQFNLYSLIAPEHYGRMVIITILLIAIFFLIVLSLLPPSYRLKRIKAKKTGDRQHGDAAWLTEQEINNMYKTVPFEPELWRRGEKLPSSDLKGFIVANYKHKVPLLPFIKFDSRLFARVETSDMHTVIYAAPGAGKTAFILYPNLEYACATGMSFVTTDTKGDLYRNYGYIAKEYYGYNVTVLDLRNPTMSHGNNIMANVNRYMDIWKKDPKNLTAKANAEKHAKLIAKSIMTAEGGKDYGSNTYFYDNAENLLAATILLVSEFGEKEERHIPSVFTLLTELLEKIDVPVSDGGSSSAFPPRRGQTKEELAYALLIKELPIYHKAREFATSAVTGSDNTILSVLTTALSKLNNFIDSEIEQILCFENEIDVEAFCKQKSALFIVLPEEDPTKYFIVSLLLQQFYRECLIYADSIGGKLKNRIMMYLDEIGTIPKINGLDMMFSASRSRDILLVPILQAESQLRDKYGSDQADTINSTIGCAMYGGFTPESDLAKTVSDRLGTVTVETGSVSSGTGNSSITLQMTSMPLITEQELHRLPKGTFIVRRQHSNPMKSQMMLFKEWGITFPGQYVPQEKQVREVKYIRAATLFMKVKAKYSEQVKATPSLSSVILQEALKPAEEAEESATSAVTPSIERTASNRASGAHLFRPADSYSYEELADVESFEEAEPSENDGRQLGDKLTEPSEAAETDRLTDESKPAYTGAKAALYDMFFSDEEAATPPENDGRKLSDKLDAKLFDEEQEALKPAEEAPTADTFKINAKPLHRKSEVKFE